MLHERDIDILCVCETWLNSSVNYKFINIPNFKIIRYDTGRGGGSCIFVRDHLSVTLLSPDVDRMEGVDDVWVQIQHRKFASFIVGCVYRHPKAGAPSFLYLSEIFKIICLKNKPVFILGDFNDDLYTRGNNMNKIINNLSLKQLVSKPTRITLNSSTLLDLVITNRKEMVISSSVFPSPVADHELLSIVLNLRKPKPKPQIVTYRCRKNYDQNIFCNLLLNETTTLNSILNTDNVSSQVIILTDTFNKCLNICAPLTTAEIARPFAPWIDETLKDSIVAKNNLQLMLKNDRSNLMLAHQFKEDKKKVECSLNKAKNNYFREKNFYLQW